MNSRERAMLRLLELRGGASQRLDLVKLLFLTRESLDAAERRTFYGFFPYKYGPYSFSVARDLDKLQERGYVHFPDSRSVTLADAGITADARLKDGALSRSLATTHARTSTMDTRQLLDKVYSEHPWFTLNTVRAGWQPPPRPVAKPAVYTVGYQGKQIDDLLDCLLRNGIKTVIDVRRNPVARRYGFHRSTLSALCAKIGIGYDHLPEFGIPSDLRRDLASEDAYEVLFQRYCGETLAAMGDQIRALAARMQATPMVLMCSEEDPTHCHRSHLAAAVARECQLPVKDIT